MPVVGEPMGIEAAEKPLVGTPDGDPTTTLVSAPTFPVALYRPRFSPAVAAFLFAVGGVIQVEQSRSYHSVSHVSLLPARRRTRPLISSSPVICNPRDWKRNAHSRGSIFSTNAFFPCAAVNRLGVSR